MSGQRKKRKRKTLQCAKMVPNSIENEPTEQKTTASSDDSSICDEPARQVRVDVPPSGAEGGNPKPAANPDDG
jgi:hypothetical protein